MKLVDEARNRGKAHDQPARQQLGAARVQPVKVSGLNRLFNQQHQAAVINLDSNPHRRGCPAAKRIGEALLDQQEILGKFRCQKIHRSHVAGTGNAENMVELVVIDMKAVGMLRKAVSLTVNPDAAFDLQGK